MFLTPFLPESEAYERHAHHSSYHQTCACPDIPGAKSSVGRHHGRRPYMGLPHSIFLKGISIRSNGCEFNHCLQSIMLHQYAHADAEANPHTYSYRDRDPDGD
jgi:hypothetical protein